MPSAIDPTKPVTGNPTTQSMRDNFGAAKSEIEALQTDMPPDLSAEMAQAQADILALGSPVTPGQIVLLPADYSGPDYLPCNGIWQPVADYPALSDLPDPTPGQRWTINETPTYQNLIAFVEGIGLLCAVGANGACITSADDVTWTLQNSGTSNALNALAANGTTIVAVGTSGTVRTTTNGTTWTTRTSNTSNNLTAIVWTGSQFVAAGSNGTIITSPDGTTWTVQTSGTANSLNGIAWSGSILVAVGLSGTTRSSPDAITWTSRSGGAGGTIQSVTWDGSHFIAVQGSPTAGYSADGINWTTAVLPGWPTPRGIGSHAGLSYITGDAGQILKTSNITDATRLASPTEQNLTAKPFYAQDRMWIPAPNGRILSTPFPIANFKLMPYMPPLDTHAYFMRATA